MIRPSVNQLLEVLSRKGYRVYDTDSVDWNLNIVGIRSLDPVPDTFDDTLVVFHRFRGIWDIFYYHITTDPSIYYLRHPIASAGQGTAILKEGQYLGAYKIDIHKRGMPGAHEAICQRLGPVTVFRDSNRDDRLNLNASQTETGMFGINLHRGPLVAHSNSANWKFSAGCQVFADRRQFDDFMLKCRNGARAFGNKFTYTLLHERDFA
jgi:hypothetical protein